MDPKQLQKITSQILAPQKGLLAADESPKTVAKRFGKIGLEVNPDNDLKFRKLYFTAPEVENYLSGVILYDETIRQEIDGLSVSKYLESKGIVPGIKVDLGTVDMPDSPGEKITEGLDGLEERLKEYSEMGAKFTKWRAVIKIGDGIPTTTCIEKNAEILAKYASIVQNLGMVPIIEPEIIRDGVHDLQKSKEVLIQTLKIVFEKIKEHRVALEGLILKSSMVTCGEGNPKQATFEEVAEATIDAFMESVPTDLPGIVFLSGGQSPDYATENLNAIAKIGGPWVLTFSYARALQDEALLAWGGKDENVAAAQKVFLERLKKVSLASQGKLH